MDILSFEQRIALQLGEMMLEIRKLEYERDRSSHNSAKEGKALGDLNDKNT